MDGISTAITAIKAVGIAERTAPVLCAEAKILAQLAASGKGITVEALTAAGEKVVGSVISWKPLAGGKTVAIMHLPEANALAERAPVSDVVALTGTLWSDTTGAVFRSAKPVLDEFPHKSDLVFAKDRFAAQLTDLRIMGRTGPLTEGERLALNASAKQIKASTGNTETFLSALSQAPKLDFGVTPLVEFPTNPVFNPRGGDSNCMTVTAGILRTMRTGQLTTAGQVEKLHASGAPLGVSYPGRFSDRFEAENWFKKAGGVDFTRHVGSMEEMAPGKPHAVDLMLKGADGEQRHMAFAYKFNNGKPFIYDGQSGFVWHSDAVSRNNLPLSFHELRLQPDPLFK